MRRKARHDEGFAALPGGDDAVVADPGAGFVARQEKGLAGDIPVAPVAVVRAHGDLKLLSGALEEELLRQNLEARAGRHIGCVVRRASFEPADERLVEFAALVEFLAARVRGVAVRFRHEHRGLGDGEIDPATGLLAGQAIVILFRIEAPEREHEAVLAACGTVAAIALRFHEDGHHIEPEADRLLHGRLLDLHRHLHRLALPLDLQLRLPIRQRIDHALFHPGFRRIGEGEFRLRRDIPMHARRFRDADDDGLLIALKLQIYIRREDVEVRLHRGEDAGGRGAKSGSKKKAGDE